MAYYEFTYRIRHDDLDFMKIVGHADWFILLQRARGDLCDAVGYPFREMEQDGIGVVIAGANIQYLRPAYNDDMITIRLTPHSPFNKGFYVKHEARNQNNKACVIADMRLVVVDPQGKAIPLSKRIYDSLFDTTH